MGFPAATTGRKTVCGLDLSADKTRYFNMSYDMLIDRGLVHHVPMNGADHDFTTPRANGSVASRLVTGGYLEPEHHGVKLTEDEFRRRCFDCHKRTVDISDAWLGRTVVTVTSRVWTDTTLMDQGLQIENSVPTFGPEYRINLTHAERSQMVIAPLAKAAGGLGLCAAPNGGPVFQDKRDPDYQAMVRALEKGAAMLKLNPRVDMLPRPDPEQPEAYAPGLQQPRLMPEKAGPEKERKR